jgi:hypothetical protein
VNVALNQPYEAVSAQVEAESRANVDETGFMPSPNLLIIDNAGNQICFNVQTHTYDLNPSCGSTGE